MQDSTAEIQTSNDSSSRPTPDFSSLRGAAATLQMFGAQPVLLFEGSGDPHEEGAPQQEDTLQYEDALDPDASPETPGKPGGEQTDGPEWQRADGIGVVAGENGWNGLLVKPASLRKIVSSLRVRDSAWIARNDESALIYFQTDASPSTLRALAATYQAGAPPRVTAGTEVTEWSTTDEDLPVLPVPPSPDLSGGHWEFVWEWPETPPPFRAFQVGADALPAGRKGENRGRSRATTNRQRAESQSFQLHQARAQSKWSLSPRDGRPFD